MGTTSAAQDASTPHAARFALTHWSMVLAAGRSQSSHRRLALEELCRTYWHPIYAFVRRQGHGPEDAQDLTQEFFARLLENNQLGGLDPAKGRFRSFLLAALRHFLANQWDRARAQKRGGGQVPLAIGRQSAEDSYAVEPAETLTPEKIFERRWAVALLNCVFGQLRAEYANEAKLAIFEELKPALTSTGRSGAYASMAGRLGMSEGAVKVAVHRLRRRYRELLRTEIARTVSSPAEVEEEIRGLFAALEGG